MDISIIIPFNKNRGYLEAAIASAQNQRFDGEYEILPIQGDYNVSTNINRGVRIAKGEYIKLLGEDDMLTRDCLQTLINRARQTRYGCGAIVAADAINWNDDGYCALSRSDPDGTGATLEAMKERNEIHGGTVLYHRTLLEQFPFDESLTTAEEYDVHLRIIKAGYQFSFVDKVVYLYRIHMGQKSQQDLKERHRIINEIKARY